jgi:chromate reductase
VRVVGICGSLRDGSLNRTLLTAVAAALPRGAEFAEWSGLETLPAYDADADGQFAPPPVAALRRALADADAVVIATPEYNASIPGALKNALDWASRPFPDNCLRGKPVAVVGASTGVFGAVWAQADLRRILKTIGADVLEAAVPVAAAHHAFTASGALRDCRLTTALRTIADELVEQSIRRAA